MLMSVLFACMHVCYMCALCQQRPEDDVGIIDRYELLDVGDGWEPNSSSLEEQPLFSTT